ncbi:hypothetical protein V1264_022042 [Littorina saxatilis]|uniref:DNA replication ATP-dependent helicase/nuclease DNA2 n=1 Tax=Littorina saxatilis TaxID=31220 RepID=A0AAN9AJN2_9CAEN
MKRSSSKKEALSEDGNQQKISSFFQKGPVQAQSKLFTNVKRTKPPLTLQRNSKASKTASVSTSGASKPASSDSKKTSGSTKTNMTVLKEFNSTVFKHAEHKTPQKSGAGADPDLGGSPDILIIPDTPEDKPKKSRPKAPSRSFLCPASMLSTMPGKRTSPPKTKLKQRTVSKPMGPVSIEFGQKRLSDCQGREESCGDGLIPSNNGKTDNLLSTGKTVSSDKACPQSAKSSLIKFGEDVDYSDFAFESGCSSPVSFPNPVLEQTAQEVAVADSKQAVTPTKSYSDGNTVKRMAKSGSSPAPKKIFQPENDGERLSEASTSHQKSLVEMCNTQSKEDRLHIPTSYPIDNSFTDSSTSHSEDTSLREQSASQSQRLVKAKRQLATMSGFRDVKEMNQSVNNYQIGGSTKGVKTNTVTCAEDDVLADILGQMDGVSAKQVHKPDHAFSKDKEHQAVALKTNFALTDEQKMDVEFSVCETQDDDVLGEILGELNSSWSLKQTADSYQQDKLRCANKKGLNPQRRCSSGKDSAQVFTDRESEEVIMTGPSVEEPMESNSPQIDESKIPTPVNTGHNSGIARHSHNTDTLKEEHKDKQFFHSLKRAADKSIHHTEKYDRVVKSQITPTKKNADCLDLPKNMEDMLAGSFDQLSPFKRKPSQLAKQGQSVSRGKFTDKWNRFAVQGVSLDRKSHEMTLELSKEGTADVIKKAILRDSWSDTHIAAGDIVHFLPREGHTPVLHDSDDDIVIDDDGGHMVVNPDLLLSGTTIVSGVYCLRRSVLNEKFKGVDSKNVHMLYGSIIHSLFQEVLKDRLVKTEEIMAIAKTIVQSNKFLHEMYGQLASETKVMEEIKAYIPPLQAWFKKHVPARNGLNTAKCSEMSVVQIHDIEETIWSPRLGVKGKIDMTVEVEMQKNRGHVRRKVVPLELKTGKASYSIEHKGQVTLYSLMMSERRENPEEGLLLYLKHNDMNSVPVKPENTRGLLQLRNEMAYYLSRQTQKTSGEEGQVTYQLGRLPPPIDSHRSCSRCPQLVNCAIYQRSVEDVNHSADHAMSSLVPDTLSHLGDSHLNYFTHWLLCMDLEAASQRTQGLRNIWCVSSSEREEKGDCLQQMVIVDSVLGVPETQAFTEGKGCCVQFQRKPGFEGGALNQVGLSKNDSVVISSEDGKYIALSTGFIKDVTEDVMDVVVDRDSFHENTAFKSLVFRIDRCDNFNTSGYLLTNLSRLMEATPHSQRLRSLIIDRRRPEFQLTLSKGAVEKVKQIFKPLNKPQKTAILKVLMSKDFVQIKGYPGTGKTSTIVALVKILRELGQSVLLTSYTHSAVDNILLKLKKDGVPFLRLGRSSRIHPDIQDHAVETLTLDITSVDELRDFYASYVSSVHHSAC